MIMSNNWFLDTNHPSRTAFAKNLQRQFHKLYAKMP